MLNQALFQRILITEDGITGSVPAPWVTALRELARRPDAPGVGLEKAPESPDRAQKAEGRLFGGRGSNENQMVRLSGACSNRQAPRLELAARRHRAILASGSLAAVPARSPLRLPAGAVQTAIRIVLDSADSPMALTAIRRAVEDLLGQIVSRNTVDSFLSVAARDPSSPIVRSRRGVYSSR
jgi:hypothetical protein